MRRNRETYRGRNDRALEDKKMTAKHGKSKMKLWQKILLGSLAFLVISAGGIFAYGTIVLHRTEDVMRSTFEELGLGSSKKSDDIIKATKPLTVLLMGIDTGDKTRADLWEGLSDTMIVMTINPQTNTTTMVSLERDMLTDVVDPDGDFLATDKLNAAYSLGGTATAVATIQQQLGLDIDKYALINMNGLKDLVDAVGGIDVNNTLDFPISIEETEPDYTATIESGVQHIDGDQALVYARMRHQDPEGDIGRQARQREVITQVVSKVLSLNSVANYEKILQAVSGNMKTDFAVNAKSLTSLLGYKDAFKKMCSIKLQGVGEMIDGGSYQVMPENNLLSVQNALRLSLGKSAKKSLSTGIVTFENYYGALSTETILPTILITVDGQTTEKTLLTDGTQVTADEAVEKSNTATDDNEEAAGYYYYSYEDEPTQETNSESSSQQYEPTD
ncbi:transporter [Lactococcus hodotermopsidis]|uniref:Transporter n=1 Tax=Pseudolactococcus hodotermopsidis TaxID=2709157 RepID=A0A6A0BBR9_9LACT|nr:LCP family protein [Lactococcus hodotermopsidis]GFH42105.1 transporter [Lactococcus hodotermopsidis]